MVFVGRRGIVRSGFCCCKTVFIEVSNVTYLNALLALMGVYVTFNLSYDKRQELLFQFIEEYIWGLRPAKNSARYRTMCMLVLPDNWRNVPLPRISLLLKLKLWQETGISVSVHQRIFIRTSSCKKVCAISHNCIFVLPDNWSHGLVLRIPLPLKLKLWQETWVSVSGHWRIYIRTLSCKESLYNIAQCACLCYQITQVIL